MKEPYVKDCCVVFKDGHSEHVMFPQLKETMAKPGASCWYQNDYYALRSCVASDGTIGACVVKAEPVAKD